MALFKISLWRVVWVALFLLFFSVPSSYAGSWGDVIDAISTCEASNPACGCWVEEVLTPARVYRVWQRCSSTALYSQLVPTPVKSLRLFSEAACSETSELLMVLPLSLPPPQFIALWTASDT